MNYNQNIQVGDLLVCRKTLGLLKHYGVYIGFNEVLQNTPLRGEHVVSLQEFADREKIGVYSTGANPSDVVTYARRILANPKKYNLILRNCEHTALEVTKGKAASPQLAGGVFLLAIVAFLFYTSQE